MHLLFDVYVFFLFIFAHFVVTGYNGNYYVNWESDANVGPEYRGMDLQFDNNAKRVIVSGVALGADGDIVLRNNGIIRMNVSSNCAFIVGYDSSGAVFFYHHFEGIFTHTKIAIDDSNGDIFMMYQGIASENELADFYIANFNRVGNLVWSEAIAGRFDLGYELFLNSGGHPCVIGTYKETTFFSHCFNSFNGGSYNSNNVYRNSIGSPSLYVSKSPVSMVIYANFTNSEWSNGPSNDSSLAGKILYSNGSSSEFSYLDSANDSRRDLKAICDDMGKIRAGRLTADEMKIGDETYKRKGQSDIYVYRESVNGSITWRRFLYGDGHTNLADVKVSRNCVISIAGSFESSEYLHMDPDIVNYSLRTMDSGKNTSFLVIFEPDGSPLVMKEISTRQIIGIAPAMSTNSAKHYILESSYDLDYIRVRSFEEGCGKGSQLVNFMCDGCLPGTYKPEVGKAACKTCPSNSNCSETAFTCHDGFEIFDDGCVKVRSNLESSPDSTPGITTDPNTTSSFLSSWWFLSSVSVGGILFCVVGAILVQKSRTKPSTAQQGPNQILEVGGKMFSDLTFQADTLIATTQMTSQNTVTADGGFYVPAFMTMDFGADFSIHEKIARGGDSSIHICDAKSDELLKRTKGRTIVFKMISPSLNFVSSKKKGAFLQEISLMYRLRNFDGFLQMYGYSVEPAGIVLPYCKFGDLKKYSMGKSQIPIPYTLPMVLCVSQQISRAIRALHALDIVHCDIKPSNILLDEDLENPDKLKAVISDFGICRIFGEESGRISGFKAVELNAASIAYAAPEIIERFKESTIQLTKEISMKGDIYAFSVLLFEIAFRRNGW